MSTITMRSQPRKGKAALQISPRLVSGGADPFMTNNSIPKGGVDKAISKLRSIRIANQMGSNPRPWITGMKMGIVIIIMETCSMNVPRIIRITIMVMRTKILDTSRPVIRFTNPIVDPVKA